MPAALRGAGNVILRTTAPKPLGFCRSFEHHGQARAFVDADLQEEVLSHHARFAGFASAASTSAKDPTNPPGAID